MKIDSIIKVLAGSLMLSGCFCTEIGKSPVLGSEAESHVLVSNYGWSLFGCIPIVCGNRNVDSWCPFAFFRDDIRLEYVCDRLNGIAEESHCVPKNMSLLADNDVLFDAYYGPVPWVIIYHEVNVSATLVREGTK